MTIIKPFGKTVRRFREQLISLRDEIHPEIHPLQMLIFLEVVNNPQYTVKAKYTEKLFNIISSSASRHCRRLTNTISAIDGDGYDLCQVVYKDNDRVSKYLELTDKGVEVAEIIRPLFTDISK